MIQPKLFVTLISVFVLLSCILSLNVPNTKTSQVAENDYQAHSLYLGRNKDTSGISYGVIPLSSTSDTNFVIYSEGLIDKDIEIEIYRAKKDNLLDFIRQTHQVKDYSIIGNTDIKVDTKSLEVVSKFKNTIKSSVQDISLPIKENGIYYTVLKYNDETNSNYIIKSKVSALVKNTRDDYLYWVQNSDTRMSEKDVKVTVYDFDNDKIKTIDSTITSANGIAQIKSTKNADLTVFEKDDSVAVMPLNLANSMYGYFTPIQKSQIYYMFTDRPVYKPGDKVYFKGIIRDDDDLKYTVATGSINVRVRGEDSKYFLNKKYTLNPNGSFDGEFIIPQSAKTGYFSINADSGDPDDYRMSGSVGFSVEYYRKPEFYLNVDTSKNEYFNKDKTSFIISGKYFSGEALNGKKVKYKIYSGDYYDYAYYYNRNNFNDDYKYGSWGYDLILNGEVTLNHEGVAEVPLDIKIPEDKGTIQVYTIEIESESSGTSNYAQKNILVYPGDFSIYRNDNDYKYSFFVNEQANLSLYLKPLLQNAKISDIDIKSKVELNYYIEKNIPYKKYPEYERKTEFLNDIQAKSDKDGNINLGFTPIKEGEYTLYLTATDSKGNNIKKTFYLYASTKNNNTPFYSQSLIRSLSYKFDKNTYKPGDIAKLTINSSIKDREVFLSVERGYLKSYQIIKIDDNKKIVEVPILENYAPDVFFEVSGFTSDTYDAYQEQVKVDAEFKKLNIQIDVNKKKFTPGEEVIVNITTRDYKGNPKPAEVTLWSIDKSLLELSYDNREKIFDTFYRERYNATDTSHTFHTLNPKGGAERGGGGDGSFDRTIFKDTPYWNPALTTDSNGQAKVTFKVPDNLTTWVIYAVGSTKDTVVGESKNEIIVTKEVILRPVLPNILRNGDTINVQTFLQNNTEQKTNFNLRLLTSSNSGPDKSYEIQKLTLEPGESKSIFWPFKVDTLEGNIKFKFAAFKENSENLADGIEIDVPVKPFGFYKTSVKNGFNSNSLTLNLNPTSKKELSFAVLSLSSSRLGTVLPVISYLVNYYYGCTEQTTTKLFAEIFIKKHPELFANSEIKINLDEDIQKGLEKLSSLQNSGGGFPWYYKGPSDVLITAHAYEILLDVKSAGFNSSYNEDSYNYYIKNLLENTKSLTTEGQIIQNYAIALSNDHTGFVDISNYKNLSTDVLAFAAIANMRVGKSELAKLAADELNSQAKTIGDSIYFEKGYDKYFGSKQTSTALAIRAFTITNTHLDTAQKAANYLISDKENFWGNTYGSVQGIKGIADLSLFLKEDTSNYNYSVSLDDEQITLGKVSGSKSLVRDVIIDVNKIKSQGSTLKITKDGDGSLYSKLVVKEFITDKNFNGENNPIKLDRTYFSPRGAGKSLAVGDIVTVQLKVSGLNSSENYAIVSDQLPAGLVPVNTHLKNEQYNEDRKWDSTYTEYTDNGANVFVWTIDNKPRIYSYKARVIADGEFSAPPAFTALMYKPEVYGISSSNTISTIKEPLPDELQSTKNKPNSVSDSKPFNKWFLYGLIIFLTLFFGIIIYNKKQFISKLIYTLKVIIVSKFKKDSIVNTPKPANENTPTELFK